MIDLFHHHGVNPRAVFCCLWLLRMPFSKHRPTALSYCVVRVSCFTLNVNTSPPSSLTLPSAPTPSPSQAKGSLQVVGETAFGKYSWSPPLKACLPPTPLARLPWRLWGPAKVLPAKLPHKGFLHPPHHQTPAPNRPHVQRKGVKMTGAGSPAGVAPRPPSSSGAVRWSTWWWIPAR